ncbi:3-isopropylmalate dehydrogenase [Alkalicoccobacillus murimartini]|uniref:3-isopropylmalate dehydrogenase n=1 Tax=Alkalicoccobacillus murimartini TaxID=171685 RepID=A0ABT9YLH0_9BACI|nr:3-isopropylmalate dehydrogenase [Alkalicoccobacillus murimartini]MDQ0208032.1 3-isopropylmalate dehydrogenase [Alkalicoccobacillus murimartini]
MKKSITLLPGDGIGPEVVAEATRVLDEIGKQYGHEFTYQSAAIGGTAIDQFNDPLPSDTLALCKESDAILLGAVGGPKWDANPAHLRPEKGLLRIRKELQLFSNLRPVSIYNSLVSESTIKEEVVRDIDLLIVRELTGGLYFGEPSERLDIDGEEGAVDTLTYKRSEIERIIRMAFQLAEVRGGKVMSVDKANVLESSRLWRQIANEISEEFPNVSLEHMLVDNAAMQLIRNPRQFDVLVTENLFGDILSDEASMISGSLGLLPSASLSADGPGIYEPIHGSAPDIAGKGLANPLATIASTAMMLKYAFHMEDEARDILNAINKALDSGIRTADLVYGNQEAVSTSEMTDAVLQYIGSTK